MNEDLGLQSLVDSCQNFQKSLHSQEPAWLLNYRKKAREQFEQSGLPKREEEDWKYLNFIDLKKTLFQKGSSNSHLSSTEISPYLLLENSGNRWVFHEGNFSTEHSRFRKTAGLEMKSLRDEIEAHPDELSSYFQSIKDENFFQNLNSAFLDQGLVIRIKAGVQLTQPIELLFYNSANQGPLAIHPRIVIIAEPNSKASVIETYAGQELKTYLTNTVMQVFLSKGAILDHCKIQRESLHAFHIGHLHVEQAQDSVFTTHSISLGANISRNQIQADLLGERVSCTINGLFQLGGTQRCDHHTRVDHKFPYGKSFTLFKGILDDKSRGIFSGRVIVHPQAQKTEAKQSTRNLILSSQAEMDPKPQLEIFADDVKCSHGATVGQLDEEALFYLRSRGVSEKDARRMLTHAFASDLIEGIPSDLLKHYLNCLMTLETPNHSHAEDV